MLDKMAAAVGRQQSPGYAVEQPRRVCKGRSLPAGGDLPKNSPAACRRR